MKLKKKVLITIGREYGSGGKAIADMLGKVLDIPVYDKNILYMLAEKTGLSEKFLEDEDERKRIPFYDTYMPLGNSQYGSLNEHMFTAQCGLIREKAQEGSGIFVGRCADQVLRRFDEAFHFFVFAPRADRLARIMDIEQINEVEAGNKILKKVDKQRRSYYQFYTDKKWGHSEGMDMLINSSTLGYEGAVNLILHFLKEKGYVEE